MPPDGTAASFLAFSSVRVDNRTVTPTSRTVTTIFPDVPGAEVVAVAVPFIRVLTATGTTVLPWAVAPFVLVAMWAVMLPEGAAAAAEAVVAVGAAAGVRALVPMRTKVSLFPAVFRGA